MSWPPDPIRYTEEPFRRALPSLKMRLAAWLGTGHPYAKARPDPCYWVVGHPWNQAEGTPGSGAAPWLGGDGSVLRPSLRPRPVPQVQGKDSKGVGQLSWHFLCLLAPPRWGEVHAGSRGHTRLRMSWSLCTVFLAGWGLGWPAVAFLPEVF